MLKKALKDICTISNDAEINTRNYLDSIDFIGVFGSDEEAE